MHSPPPDRVSGGVAGVAQVEQVRGEVMFLCRDDQAADRRAAAGMIVRDGLVQFQDGLHGLVIHALCGGVGQ